MDKLQPLIRNRFWILSGLLVVLALYGYYSANSQLRAETAQREDELAKKLQGVPDGNSANEDYASKLAEINSFYETSVSEVLMELWDHQQSRMTWPRYAHAAAPKEFMGRFPRNICVLYQQDYPNIMQQLEERIEPVMPLLQQQQQTTIRRPLRPTRPAQPRRTEPQNQIGNLLRPDGTIDQSRVPWKQKVILNANLPRAQLSSFNITSQEMWDAQIDVWMARLLIDAIVTINKDKESVTEGILRRVDRLELIGGTGEGGDSMMAAMGMEEFGMEGMEGMEGMMGEQMGGLKMAPVVSSVVFDPAQEFGPAIDQSGMGGEGGDFEEFGEMGGMMGAAGAAPLRYIGSEEGPFLERGFYMSVIIMQKQIPEFLTQLANSDWPIKVKRFNVGLNPYRTEANNITQAPSSSMTSNLPGGRFGGRNMSQLSSIASSMGYGGMLEGLGMGEDGGMAGGMGFARTGGSGNPLAQNLPPFAMSAMQHPDLVQLDLCGIITMYRPPDEALAALRGETVAEEEETTEESLDPADVPTEETPVIDPEMLNESDREEMPLEATDTPEASEVPETDSPLPESPAPALNLDELANPEEPAAKAPPFPVDP